MSIWLKWTLLIFAVTIGLYGLDRLLLAMESRGWIYYRKLKPKETLRAGLGAFQKFVEPQIQHIEEDRSGRLAADPDEEGAPPGKRPPPKAGL